MMIQKLAFSFAIAMISVSGCSGNDQAETAHVNNETHNEAKMPGSSSQLPSFLMLNENGQSVDLQTFKGKKVFVNLWATWCPPCRAELPSIQKLMADLDTSKVSFVFLSLDDDFGKAKSYMAAKKLNLPVYYPAQNLPLLFNVQSIPTTFIFDEQGEIMKSIVGMEDYNTKAFRKLLQ